MSRRARVRGSNLFISLVIFGCAVFQDSMDRADAVEVKTSADDSTERGLQNPSAPPASLTLQREAPSSIDSEIQEVFAATLKRAHPELPEETIQLVAGLATEEFEKELPDLDARDRALLLESIRLNKKELANLPFTESNAHLEWSVDYLLNQIPLSAQIFVVLKSPEYYSIEQGRRTTRLMQNLLSTAVESLYQGDRKQATEVVSTLLPDLEQASRFLFSPEGKFPPSDESIAKLKVDLERAVSEVHVHGPGQKRFTSHRRYGRTEDSSTDLAPMNNKLYRAEAVKLFTLIHSTFKKAIPADFWEKVKIPSDYEANSAALNQRRRALLEQESAVIRTHDGPEE